MSDHRENGAAGPNRLDAAPCACTDPADDPRVAEVVEAYLAALEAGEQPERRRYLERYPELAGAITECLDGLQLVHSLTPSFHVGAGAPPRTLAVGAATPLGDFQLLREIGRGGMGIVYEALQLSLGRRVALKVLPFAAALDARQLQRFKNEAQAAAQLHHPNIVPVYAVGCERGVHYYAMQYVEGQSLAALIRALAPGGVGDVATVTAPRHAEDETTEPAPALPEPGTSDAPTVQALSTEHSNQRAAYFRRVAEIGRDAALALEHAHQLGVIHRDIKPANLLLEGGGRVWVADFGLALFQSGPGLTITGELLGTLRYMSPEQALAKHGLVDHRTDLYALGATLYELLTLRPAVDGEDRVHILRQLSSGEPPAARRVDRSIPEELETILLKAMAHDPAERYATAAELAEDLRRFLEDRPILARRPPLHRRAARWARRHRAVVATAVVLLALAFVGLVAATGLIAGAYERERANADEARQQRRLAEENFQRARRAVDRLAKVAEEELPHVAPVDGARRQLLESALEYYQEFLENAPEDPSIQAELQASRDRVRRLLGELSALHGAARLRLLGDSAVQKELNLTEAQRAQVGRLIGQDTEHWKASYRDYRKLGVEGRRARTLERARAAEEAIAALLEPAQAARFGQILLQVQQRGRHGFTDPELVRKLKLTPAQREKIRKIQDEAILAHWDGPPGEWLFRKGRKSRPDPWEAAHARVMEILTPEQAAHWRALTGAPVALASRLPLLAGPEFAPPPPGPPGRGGPPGRFGPGRPRRP